MGRQCARRRLPHLADTQRIKKARQGGGAGARNGRHDIGGGFLGHARQRRQLRRAEAVEIGGIVHAPAVHQGRDELVPQAVDVHGAPRGKVAQGFLALGRAGELATAAGDGLALGPHHRRATFRTLGRQGHLDGIIRPLLDHHPHHFGNHIPGAAHDHGVTDAHVLAAQLIEVVQADIADDDPAHRDGRETRHGRDGAGAPHLEGHRQHPRDGLLGGIFVGQRPARGAGNKTQALLAGHRIDLVHHPVDLERQFGAARLHLTVIGQQARDAADAPVERTDRQAPRAQPAQALEMGVRQCRVVAARAQPIGEPAQRTARRDTRVELTQAARSRVARIGENALTGLLQALVHGQEARARHIDLAAHLQQCRPVAAREAQRQAGQGAQVGGHVLAADPVAARRPAHQSPVLIEQAHGQAIQLGLGAVGDRPVHAQTFPHPAVERLHLGRAEGIVQRQHRLGVGHAAKGRGRRAAHALGRRIGCDQVRPACLQGLQLAHQDVVLGIADFRRIQHVIAVIVVADRGAQALDLGLRLGALGDAHQASVGNSSSSAWKPMAVRA